MNAETVAEWMRRQGHHVYHSESSYWYDAGPRVLQAFPYHWLIQPSEKELRRFMLSKGIVALRYSAPIDSDLGMASYHVVLKPPYCLEMLPHQARNGVKRGLTHFQIEQIPFERLADEGWSLQQDTLERQNRTSSMTKGDWQKICLAAKGLPGFEAWAAISEGELAAALITHGLDDTWHIPYALNHRKFLRDHVNNALFYSVCCNVLDRPGIRSVFFCIHSLDAPDSVNEFKFRMNFSAVPVRQRIVFNPMLTPFVNQPSLNFVQGLLKRYPDNHLLSKAEGMMRFSLLGKKPLYEQDWPECVSHYKLCPPEKALRQEKTYEEPVGLQVEA